MPLNKPPENASADVVARYNEELQGVRDRALPEIESDEKSLLLIPAIKIERLVRAAQRKVYADVGMTKEQVDMLDANSDTYNIILTMLECDIGIDLIPRLAQILRTTFSGRTTQYADTDQKLRIDALKETYAENGAILNPEIKTDVKYSVYGANTKSKSIFQGDY